MNTIAQAAHEFTTYWQEKGRGSIFMGTSFDTDTDTDAASETTLSEQLFVADHTVARMEQHINVVYMERNELVALVMKMCGELNFTYGLRRDPNAHEIGWDYIAFFDLPSGQCSYHIPNDELHFFAGMPTYPHAWDGHTTPEKRQRIQDPQLGRSLAVNRPWGLTRENTLGSSFTTRRLTHLEAEEETLVDEE